MAKRKASDTQLLKVKSVTTECISLASYVKSWGMLKHETQEEIEAETERNTA